MIYDCFTFFNELDLLEIRLNELNEFVDKFVIVEANETFTRKKKPLYFEKNKNKFKQFLNKIIYIVVDDYSNLPSLKNLKIYKENKRFAEVMEKNPSTWQREVLQRNFISAGIANCSKNDIILVSDVDEIPNLSQFSKLLNFKGIIGFKQQFFYYYLNSKTDQDWIGTKAVHYSDFTNAQDLRNSTTQNIINQGGWHFSFLGGLEKIILKINSTAHQEVNTPEYNSVENINFNINNNLDIFGRGINYNIVKIDSSFPKYIIKNKNKFSKYIKKNNSIINYGKNYYRNIILNERKKIENLNEIIFNLKCEIEELKKNKIKT